MTLACNRCYQAAVAIKLRIYQHISAEWVFLLLLGIIMALLSFGMDFAIQKLQEWHYSLYTESQNYDVFQYFVWVCFPLLCIVISVIFVHFVSPQAIGSGIPEMKTIMRGAELDEYLTFRVLGAKIIGLITSLGSRLPIGKEGPFVHIAGIVATILNKILNKCSNNSLDGESHTYEMLAAACAVGVACNFGAPIGGVLFSIEVTASYFAVRNYWRGFFGAVCGALVFRLLAVWIEKEETIIALFKTDFPVFFPYDLRELLAFVGIGIVSGFAGALFVWMHRQIVEFNQSHNRVCRFLRCHRFIYAVIVSLIISTLTYPRGFGQLMSGELTLQQALHTLFDNKAWARLGESLNTTAKSELIKAQAGWKHPKVDIFVTLVVFIVMHFFMTAIAITLPVPSGVFLPVFLIGAAFGRLVGEIVAAIFPDEFCRGDQIYGIVPGRYAVVGAASLSGAVTHTISTSVIVIELTGQISHILPVMIAVLISNAIAQRWQPSIYDSIILIKGLPYLPDVASSTKNLYSVFVQDFMIRDIKYVSCTSTYEDIQTLLAESRRLKTFPIVDSPDSMILTGSIQRFALEHLLETRRLSVAADNQRPSASFLLDRVDFVDSQVDPAMFQLVEQMSLHKAHSLFSLLGLGPAYVTREGKLVGVMSLKELRLAIQGTTTNQP